jgi:hypothetical protein
VVMHDEQHEKTESTAASFETIKARPKYNLPSCNEGPLGMYCSKL